MTIEAKPAILVWSQILGRVLCGFLITALLANSACQPISKENYQADALPQCINPRPVADPVYLIFFEQHSDVVHLRGAQIISEFVHTFSNYHDLSIVLFAGEDASEVLSRDRNLDRRRGRAVERLMRQDGIAADSEISIVADGTRHPLVPTPPLTAEPQNRRVELQVKSGRQIRPTPCQADCIDWLRTHRCDPQVSAAQAANCKQVEKVAHEFQP